MAEDTQILTHFLGRLRGASQPILAETNDGQAVVVKFRLGGETSNLLFNEAMGSELYAEAGLPVPGWMPVQVTENFLEQYPGCWPVDGVGTRRPETGKAFGSQYVQAGGDRVTQILAGSSLSRVERGEEFWLAWLLDVCAQHADHRQALFVEGKSRRLSSIFIDHGQMFGGPAGACDPRFRASRFLDSRLYPAPSEDLKELLLQRMAAIRCDLLRQRAEALPAEWCTVSGMRRLNDCLGRIERPSLLANMLDTLFSDCAKQSRAAGTEGGFPVQRESLTGAQERDGMGGQSLSLDGAAFGSRCA